MAGTFEIAQRAGVKPEDAKKVMQAFADMIAEGKEKIIIQGLGNIDYSYRGAKQGRNPSSGEAVEVPAKVVPKMNFNRNLKEAVDGNKDIKKAAKAVYDELAAKREGGSKKKTDKAADKKVVDKKDDKKGGKKK